MRPLPRFLSIQSRDVKVGRMFGYREEQDFHCLLCTNRVQGKGGVSWTLT